MRRLERDLVIEFERALEEIGLDLRSDNASEALRLVGLPDTVRGYESLKQDRANQYRVELTGGLADFA